MIITISIIYSAWRVEDMTCLASTGLTAGDSVVCLAVTFDLTEVNVMSLCHLCRTRARVSRCRPDVREVIYSAESHMAEMSNANRAPMKSDSSAKIKCPQCSCFGQIIQDRIGNSTASDLELCNWDEASHTQIYATRGSAVILNIGVTFTVKSPSAAIVNYQLRDRSD